MKKLLFVIVFAAAVIALIFAYWEMSKERVADSEGESPVASESKIVRDSKGENSISLDTNEQDLLALKVVTLTAVRHSPEAKGYGRVIDPTPLSSIVAELVAAQATANASQKELERLTALSAQQNASVRALQSATAQAQRDQTMVFALRQKFIASWGAAIAEHDDLPKWCQSLTAGETALLRLDLPAGEVIEKPPSVARVFALNSETNAVEAQFVGNAPTIDPSTQGQGFLYLVASRQLGFVPGAAVLGYLKSSTNDREGVLLPRSAVVRFDGKPWVFLKRGEDTFVRREVELQSPMTDGWFTDQGVKAGDAIVVSGAQMLLSEELKSQIQIGD